ncbi:chemotaxis protein [Devosia limi DSM 17137]|uniref:Chemotaxis protein n=1 Tax=Devosia limi DSM 17137 TaxID=1121477 RepID=A0A0F5LL21_9HYPH|nr:PAS domain-containing methyl-accepting chemotaxis protein [Devosia limi]KKB82889.1 chemotaxis protein [Devosia limi DSM 17137]SHF50424.1 methyl-accepting chemotaxis protein [Devosia limi DSM 17137]
MFTRKPRPPASGVFTVNDRQLTQALHRAQAVIEFRLDGTVVAANENFLACMGYALDEIVGRHHSIFVDPSHAQSPEYKAFWKSLAAGEYQSAEYRRFAKGKRAVWIQATYNPIFDRNGEPCGVVKFATDVTARKRSDADARGQIDAISRSQAVIEFETDGTIITANENFCSALGYSLEEIVGRHHRIFVDPAEVASAAYTSFWNRLRDGQYQSAEYRRIGKNGADVWIQATYNPIFAPSGRIYKIVKFATDITARKNAVRVLGCQLEDMANGTIVDTLSEPLPREFDDIRLALKSTLARFVSFVQDLKATAHELRSATASIASGARDLAGRTEQQGRGVDDLSRATAQLSGTITANAQRAESASQKARSAAAIASETDAVVGDANKAMISISESSAKISGIIGIIDDIAFQTNLLALNASVEAARAGEAGKGFAVVAVEVRRLAQSTATASSQIKGLIETSGREVDRGTRLVSETHDRVEALLGSIADASRLVAEIADATREQAATIGNVSDAVRLIDQMTRHNSGLVRETNQAVSIADSEAMTLDHIADSFTVDAAASDKLRMRQAG